MMLNYFTLFHLVLDKLAFCSKLFNGTRIWDVNMFLLTKLMIDKIKLCNYVFVCKCCGSFRDKKQARKTQISNDS